MNWTLELEDKIQNLPKEHKNIRTLGALEKLIENLDKIDIKDIEKLTDEPVPDLLYKYDLFVKSDKEDPFGINGWIAISEDSIPNRDRIPELLKKGILRLHNPYLKDLIAEHNYKNI